MSTRKETITVPDSRDFRYKVEVVYAPHFGFATAYYRGRIIDQVELGRILEPMGDDDREWEQYEERYAEWRDEIQINLISLCKKYFDTL